MKYVSLFTGVGGFDLGFDRAGMQCVGQVEQDKHCQKVLEYHWPDAPRIGDVRDVTESTFAACDLVCGGFPCTDVSVAGNRAGLAGKHSGLWFEFLRVLQCLKPRWCVIENVPGLLSSNAGRDFATILHGLGECGYQSAWRIFDSQYWGVAQRRRRLFLVGYIGDGRAAEVLFEREGGYWNTPTRSEAGTELARDIAATLRSSGDTTGSRVDNETGLAIVGTLAASGAASARPAGQRNELDFLIPFTERGFEKWVHDDVTATLNAHGAKEAHDLIVSSAVSPPLTSEGADSGEDGRGRHAFVISAVNLNASSTTDQPVRQSGIAGTLANSRVEGVFNQTGVRRLTPMECERLQGFPPGWTAVDGMSDAQRYRQMGNAVSVPVAEWLGRRIVAAEGGGTP